VDGGRALRAGGKVDVANGALITHAPREPRTASTLAGCPVRVCRHVSGFVAAVDGGRALRAVGKLDVANGALITRAPREPRTASTLAGCPVRVCRHVSGFVAAVKDGRALRAVGVADVPNGALVARAPREPRTASTLARCLVSIRCHVRRFAAAVKDSRALRAVGVADVPNGTLVARARREPRTASTLARCLVSIRCHVRRFAAAVKDGRALRTIGVADGANGTLVARAPREPKTASTLARCLVSIGCRVSGFAAAVNGTRALRAVGVRNGADRTRFRTRFSDAFCVRRHPRSLAGFCADIGVCDVCNR